VLPIFTDMFGKKKQAKLDEIANRPLMSSDVTEFMEKLGLSEEEIADMANPVSAIDEVQVKADESEAALGAFVTETNAAWSKQTGALVDLQPYLMLPAVCWELPDKQDHALLVEVMGLLPASPWNVVLLAADNETAAITGAARMPTDVSDEAVAATSLAKITIAEELEMLKNQSQDAAFAANRDGAAARIVALARPVGAAMLGQEVVDHSRTTFFGD